MPFQITFSNVILDPPAVILITAGEDQALFCGTTVVLTASVDDPADLPGHNLEWEQIQGNPVALTCPTCLTTTYPMGDTTNKVFRFWIDRGQANQQYEDVAISHTPESDQPNVGIIATPVIVVQIPSDSPECSSLIFQPGDPIFISGQSPVGLTLLWGVPPDAELQPFITQYTVYEDDIPVQTTLVNEPRIYENTTPSLYKIFTEFEVNGQYSSEFSCEVDDTAGEPFIAIDEIQPDTASIATPALSVVRYGNIFLRNLEVNQPDTAYITTPTASVSRFSNAFISDHESNQPDTAYITTPTTTITRTSSGAIGGD